MPVVEPTERWVKSMEHAASYPAGSSITLTATSDAQRDFGVIKRGCRINYKPFGAVAEMRRSGVSSELRSPGSAVCLQT